MGKSQSKTQNNGEIRATAGSKKLAKLGVDPWTGHLLISFCCPRCHELVDIGDTNKPPTCCNFIKYSCMTIKGKPIGRCEDQHKIQKDKVVEVQENKTK